MQLFISQGRLHQIEVQLWDGELECPFVRFALDNLKLGNWNDPECIPPFFDIPLCLSWIANAY
jgi:hypothetical protein